MRKQKRLNRQRTIRKFRVNNAVKKHSNRLRLTVFRTAKHIYAQIIDDTQHKTLASASTVGKEFRALGIYGGNVAAAQAVGKILAERAKTAGVTQACFDRNGHQYHGRVKALAEAVRIGGIDLGAGETGEDAK